jgi:hypothetical protein
MLLLFSLDEVIKLLKLIFLINENFNNQVVKTGCSHENCPIWESGEFEKNLIIWRVLANPKKIIY